MWVILKLRLSVSRVFNFEIVEVSRVLAASLAIVTLECRFSPRVRFHFRTRGLIGFMKHRKDR